MGRQIIVVTAAYGHQCVESLGGQQAVLPIIAAAGADGVEIRREMFSPQELDALPALGAAIREHNLKACYSAPQALFAADGSLNPQLASLMQEAKALNAQWLKLSLGHFNPSSSLSVLRETLASSSVPLVVENDQTDCGKLLPMLGFLKAITEHPLPLRLTFDMANWLWVGDSPEAAAQQLASGVGYVHVKAAQPHASGWRAVPPDSDPRWAELLALLPNDVPRGIEFPLEGSDLVAVTHRYVRMLREEAK